jgi:hypothetical protein
MAKKSCTTYHGDNWNYPAGYKVTECEITFTRREVIETAIEVILDEGMVPGTITLKTDCDDDLEIDFYSHTKKGGKFTYSSDWLTYDELVEVEELLEDEDDTKARARLSEILYGDMSDKMLDKDLEY